MFISEAAAVAGSQVKTGDPYGDMLLQWAARIQVVAQGQWRSVANSGFICGMPTAPHATCDAPAVGKCKFCPRTVCLLHAAVAINGAVICVACLDELLQRHKAAGGATGFGGDASPPPRPPEENPMVTRLRHLKTLGLDPAATLVDIKKRWRKFTMTGHPDKGGDEAIFKKMNEAFTWLKNHSSS